MRWCCDRHPGAGFHLRNHFNGRFLSQGASDGQLYYGDEGEANRPLIDTRTVKKRKKQVKNRSVCDRKPLQGRLLAWRTLAHSTDALHNVRPAMFILDKLAIRLLSTVHPIRMASAAHVVLRLDETVTV